MTTATKAEGAVLPVLTYRYMRPGGDFHYTDYFDAADPDCVGAESLTLHAPAQATIDELRAEVERLTREREDLQAKLRDPVLVHIAMLRGEVAKPAIRDMLHVYGEKALEQYDRGAALKAKQIDVEAVMRLARLYALAQANGTREQLDAAREALRASLLGDDEAARYSEYHNRY